ncbi:MAG: choice-of-anchor Q domain-containing protein [Candidatus Saccharibacteria bacterium]
MTQQFIASNIFTAPSSKSSKIKNIIALLAVTLLAVLVSFIFAPKAHATTYNVAPTPAFGNCDIYSAIIAADTQAASGFCPAGSASNTINMSAGTYGLFADVPPITGSSNINIVGAGAENTIVDGTGNFNGLVISSATENTYSVSNLTFQNFSPPAGHPVFAISSNVTVDSVIGRNNTCLNFAGGPVCALFLSFSDQPITINIKNSAFYENTAVFVLAISNAEGSKMTANITNNTFSGNNAFPIDILNLSSYGPTTMTANITNNTFAQNAQAQDFGDPNLGAINVNVFAGEAVYYPATVKLLNNIFYANLNLSTAQNCPAAPGTNGTITSLGGNISDDNTCATYFTATNDLNSTDALISPLALDMGTYVRAINASSPAYNNAIASGAPSTDQRGVARPQEGGYDSGAYEYVTPEPTPTPTPTPGTLASTGWDTRLPALLATVLVLTGLTGLGYAFKK